MKHRTSLIILALLIVETTMTFEATMIFAALPTLIRIFGDPSTAGWLVTIHLLVASGSALVAARIGDLRGRKRVMLVLVAIAAVGSVIAAVGSAFWIVLIGRAMQGAVGAMLPLGIGVVRETLPSDKVPLGVGLIVTAASVGSAAGIVIGGVIIDNFHWQWLFAAAAAMLFVSLLAVWIFIPATPGAAPELKIDWVDGILPITGITALLLALSMSKSSGWADPLVLGLGGAGLLFLIFWARRNMNTRYPLLNLRLLFSRNVAIANIISVFMALGTYHVMLVFAPLMQAPEWTVVGLGLTATVAGLAKLPSNLLAFTAGPIAGWIAARFSNRGALVVGSCVAVVGWGSTTLMPVSLYEIIGLICLISFGTTMLMTACLNLVATSVPEESTSEAIASLSVIRAMFMAIGSQVIAILLSTETISQPGGTVSYPALGGYQTAIIWISAMVIAGLVSALLVRPPDKAVTPSLA